MGTENLVRDVCLPARSWVLPARLVREKGPQQHCQTNLTEPAKGADVKRSGCKLTPFRECGSAVLFEDVAAVEMAVEVEMVVD